jgi:hypothetical protein
VDAVTNLKGNIVIGKKCIIRCCADNIYYGTVTAHEWPEVMLSDSRRLWRWNTGGSLSAIAMMGIDASVIRIDSNLPKIILLDALEIIPTSDTAQASIEAA